MCWGGGGGGDVSCSIQNDSYAAALKIGLTIMENCRGLNFNFCASGAYLFSLKVAPMGVIVLQIFYYMRKDMLIK